MSISTSFVCERCKQPVEPAADNVLAYVEMIKVDDFDGTEYIEGMGVFFHARCSPPVSQRRFRRVDRPAV